MKKTSSTTKIKDLEGNELEITNLQEAINQAKEFSEYKIDIKDKFQLKTKQYWEHLYNSLTKLK